MDELINVKTIEMKKKLLYRIPEIYVEYIFIESGFAISESTDSGGWNITEEEIGNIDGG